MSSGSVITDEIAAATSVEAAEGVGAEVGVPEQEEQEPTVEDGQQVEETTAEEDQGIVEDLDGDDDNTADDVNSIEDNAVEYDSGFDEDDNDVDDEEEEAVQPEQQLASLVDLFVELQDDPNIVKMVLSFEPGREYLKLDYYYQNGADLRELYIAMDGEKIVTSTGVVIKNKDDVIQMITTAEGEEENILEQFIELIRRYRPWGKEATLIPMTATAYCYLHSSTEVNGVTSGLCIDMEKDKGKEEDDEEEDILIVRSCEYPTGSKNISYSRHPAYTYNNPQQAFSMLFRK